MMWYYTLLLLNLHTAEDLSEYSCLSCVDKICSSYTARELGYFIEFM